MLRHAASEIHKQTAAGRKGRLPGQPTLLAVTVAADHNSNQEEGARQEGARQEGARQDGARQEGAGHEGARQEGARQDEGRREEAGGRLQNAPASLTRPVMTISDQTTKAETILALKVVDSNYSYQSCDNIVSILQAMDPDSKVFKKMSMGESRVSYTISHGLLPYFKKKIVRAIQESPAYSLGTDAGTFKLHGLSKLVDIQIRFWDEGRGEVVDLFLDYHSVGHEPATVQVRHMQS